MTSEQIRLAARDRARKVVREFNLADLDHEVEADLERGVASKMTIDQLGDYAKAMRDAGAPRDTITAIFLFTMAFSLSCEGLTAGDGTLSDAGVGAAY